MTALDSLLFITIILIDYKIINFSLYLLAYLFTSNHIDISKFISTTLKERMIMNIIFAGATPIIINEKFVFQWVFCIRMYWPHYTALYKKNSTSCYRIQIRKMHDSVHDSVHPYDQWATAKRQKGNYTLFLMWCNVYRKF